MSLAAEKNLQFEKFEQHRSLRMCILSRPQCLKFGFGILVYAKTNYFVSSSAADTRRKEGVGNSLSVNRYPPGGGGSGSEILAVRAYIQIL